MTTHPTTHSNQREAPHDGRSLLGRGVPLGAVLFGVLVIQALIVWAGVALYRAF